MFFLRTSATPCSPTSYSVAREAEVLRWLSGRLRVPELICSAQHEGYEHMITRAVPGVPLFSLMENEAAMVDLFLEALRQLQSVAVADCPFDGSAFVATGLPRGDLVFAHGDLGDVNVLVDAREELSFIDLGRGGRADRCLDIASIHRNLRDDISKSAAARFLDGLGLPDAPEKREFFEHLDEF